jgi:membrane protease YdiL (CAAX protease family)
MMTTSAAHHYMLMLLLSIFPGVVLAWWRARQSGIAFGEYIRLIPERSSIIRLSVYGIACYCAAVIGRTAINTLLSSSDPGAVYIQPATTQIMRNIAQLMPLTTISFVVAVAIIEEIIFRGWLISEIQRLCARNKDFVQLSRPIVANILAVAATSILFAMSHASLPFFPAFLVVGIVFGSARVLTGSLVPSVVAHVLMNYIAALSATGWI